MKIGERIKARREELGLTLEAVGEGLGVNRSTVLRYESGETKRLDEATIEKLARILQTTPAWLITGEDLFEPDIITLARIARTIPKDRRDILIRIARTMSDVADEESK